MSEARVLVVACAALTRELRAVLGESPVAAQVTYLPAPLHNRPERIPDAVLAAVDAARAEGAPIERVVVGYGDCGTGGLLDAALDRLRADGLHVQRLPGPHCYEFFAGADRFASLHDAEPGTFYLTDYLARHFDALVWSGLGLDRHPSLRDAYFGNYRRVVLVSQSTDPAVVDAARAAASRLGLAFEHEHVGLDPFRSIVTQALGEALGDLPA